MKGSPYAGKPAEAAMLVNVPRLVTAYYAELPDPSAPDQHANDITYSLLPDALGGKPNVRHLNEGHVAFVVLERARAFMAENRDREDV